MSTPATIYRLEFKNVEEFTVRIDIAPTDIALGSGSISPAVTSFQTLFSGDKEIRVSSTHESFFYIGQTINVTGTSFNNTTFTVLSFYTASGTTFVNVSGTIAAESTFTATLTDPSVITSQNIIELKGGANPLVISASNNDEDKFTQIRSKSAKITFRSDSSNGLNSATFSQGGDNLFKVDIYLQDTPELIFTGFLMMADNQQPFQPDPQYVTLTATDHLAALKESALLDFDGINPVGKYRVAELLAMALNKTGLALNIYVVNNLRAGGGTFTMAATITGTNTVTVASTRMFYVGQRIGITTTAGVADVFVTAKTATTITIDGVLVNVVDPAAVFADYNSQFHWYNVVYLDAKTFESQIGESENCYSVIEKILGENCYITQWKGNWWIMRVDEFDGRLIYVDEFDSFGTYVSQAAGTTYNKSIGRNEDFKFAHADTLLRFVRPHGFVKERFDYDTPKEVPCNVDFSRGNLVSESNPLDKTYELDCWGKYRENYPTSGLIAATVSIYIHRLFNEFDLETSRYVVIPWAAVSSNLIMSEDIKVNVKDRFSVGMSRRLSADVSGSGFYRDNAMQVRLYGDDGTFWTLQGETSVGDTLQWVDSNSDFTTNNKYFWFEGDVDRDMTDPESIYGNTTAPPVPVAGIINLLAHQSHQAAWNRDTYIDSVSFEYIPYINGSYQKYSGQSATVTRIETGYSANRDKNVYISDSPAPLYKGSMFLYVNSAYILFPVWFDWSITGAYPTDLNDLNTYNYNQAFAVWNQYKGFNDPTTNRGIGINIFAGSVKGLTDSWPDLLHKYLLTDLNEQTNDRFFMLISLEQNWKTCISSMTFIEVFNTAIGKTYTDDFDFKYLTS